jgi:hypothetical protein
MSIDEPLPPQPQSLNLSEEEKIQSVAHCPREIDLDDPTTFKKILVPLCVRCVSPLKLDVLEYFNHRQLLIVDSS